MIDLLFAEKNINKYKWDYDGYLVIVDKIRTIEVLQSYDLQKMQRHLQDLYDKYNKELNLMRKIEKVHVDKKININKLTKKQIISELQYILKRLPAIGFILLGKGKDIGVQSSILST